MALSDAIDEQLPVQGNPTTASVRANFLAAKSAIAQLELTAGIGPQGFSVRAWSTAANLTDIASIPGMAIGDYVVNTGADTRTILGVATLPGGVVHSTSQTAGTAAGSLRGAAGSGGAAATVAVGTVTTGAAGSAATVTNSGTTAAAVLNFTLPRGESGTGGSGITEAQAIDAVRKGQPVFEEATVVNAVAWPTTNVAQAPTLGANWTLGTGSGATGGYDHAAGSAEELIYPVGTLTQTAWYQIAFTATATTEPGTSARRFQMILRTSATGTANQQSLTVVNRFSGTITIRTLAYSYTHLVIVPNTAWAGRFTLTRVTAGGTPVNSQSLAVKTDFPVTVRGNSIAIGNGLGWLSAATNGCVAIGVDALRKTVSGTGNTAVGRGVLAEVNATNNTAVGDGAMGNAIAVTQGAAVGVNANRYVLSGTGNVGVGYWTGTYWSDNPGSGLSENVFLGSYAGGNVQTGSHNIAIGQYAMVGWGPPNYQNELIGNIAIGGRALMQNRNSSVYVPSKYNIAIGYSALEKLTLESDRSIAIGYRAAIETDKATDSIFIGSDVASAATGAASTSENEIVIGHHAIGHGDHTITLGNDEITDLHCNVQTISTLSDPRVKEEIGMADLGRCLDAVKMLPLHRWAWGPKAGKHRDRHVSGFLTSELKMVFPKAVTATDEWRTQRDADGNVMTKIVEDQIVEGEPTADGDWHQTGTRTEQRRVEDRILVKDVERAQLTELLPTLWGAVQQIIKRLEALEAK